MRIQILTPEYDGSGGGIFTFYGALVSALRDRGAEVRLIEGSAVHATGELNRREENGVQKETLELKRLDRWIERFSAYSATPHLRRHLAAAWAMWEQADYGAGSDIVEAADWGLLFVPPAVEATQPLVVQCHGSIGQIAYHDPIAGEAADNLFIRLIERSVLSNVETLQTLSGANADFWRAETGQTISKMLPAWSRTKVQDPEAPGDRGLVVGRLQRWKGPVAVCEALQLLGLRAPFIDWIGRDTAWCARDKSTAEHLAQSFPSIWNTKFVHYSATSPQEVARRQTRALFNIVPSTWDVFNFTAVEAMASGRPAIVSTGAGASELVEDGVNGYLFTSGDAAALASAIERVLSESPVRLAEIGREAQKTVRRLLDPQTIAAQRIDAYRGAIESFRTKAPAPIGGWLGAVCRPSETLGYDATFLENVPLQVLAKHLVRRIYRLGRFP